jgi:hypothetical protein
VKGRSQRRRRNRQAPDWAPSFPPKDRRGSSDRSGQAGGIRALGWQKTCTETSTGRSATTQPTSIPQSVKSNMITRPGGLTSHGRHSFLAWKAKPTTAKTDKAGSSTNAGHGTPSRNLTRSSKQVDKVTRGRRGLRGDFDLRIRVCRRLRTVTCVVPRANPGQAPRS